VLTFGAHVPLIAGILVELSGKTGAVAFWQTAGMAANVGNIVVVVTILKFAVVAHWPDAGVNAYTAVPATAVLTTGDHVPGMGVVFVEFVGNVGAVEFKQTSETGLKVGTVGAIVVTVKLAVDAHCPAVGVNV
jgi:hypothetical protein